MSSPTEKMRVAAARAVAATLVVAAARLLARWAWSVLTDERRLLRAKVRQLVWDDGVSAGRELQQAMISGEPPFPPAYWQQSRRGVDHGEPARPVVIHRDGLSRPSPRPRTPGDPNP